MTATITATTSKRVGDRERAIENLDRLRAQAAVGVDNKVVPGGYLLNFFTDLVDVRSGRDVDRHIRHRRIGQIMQRSRAVDDHESFFRAVIVEDVDDAKPNLRIAQRQRDEVSGAQMVLVRKRLADDHVVFGAKFCG